MEKSETKYNYSGDDLQSEKIRSTLLKCQIPSNDFPHEIVEISSEITRESGQTFGSQETISADEMYEPFRIKNFLENILVLHLLCSTLLQNLLSTILIVTVILILIDVCLFLLSAGTGNTTRNLHPRQHMDKLSEYNIYIYFVLKFTI